MGRRSLEWCQARPYRGVVPPQGVSTAERRKLSAVILALVLIPSAVYVAYTVAQSHDEVLTHSSSVTHVRVEGNDDFNSTNGVVSGTGAMSDPYVISFPEADHYNQVTIEISNTSVPFVLRDTEFSLNFMSGGMAWTDVGVRISNATDFSVDNNSLSCYLRVDRCSDFTLSGNRLLYDLFDRSLIVNCSDYMLNNNTRGKVSMVDCADFSLSGNVNSTLLMYGCRDSVVTGNRLVRGVIALSGCHGCLIQSNRCQSITIDAGSANCSVVMNSMRNGSMQGVFLDHVENVTVDGNVIENCSHHGIELWESVRDCTITRNNISGCYGAIVLRDAQGCEVYHNNVFSARSLDPILDEQGWLNSWDAGYPGGGNYYFDYAGPDVYSGPDQDEPGPDGIGDTEVVVYTYLPGDPGVDHYPLVAPYSG